MRLHRLLLLVVAFVVSPVWAATTLDLYTDEAILATDARQSDQDEAVSEALERVLVRVTGREDIVREEAVRNALDDANDYLSTFRFENSDVTLTNVLGEQVPTKRMVMQFDQGSVEQFLVRNRLPVWGAKRPETLVWLADRLDGSERILSDSDGSDMVEALTTRARERGVPLVLPIMDLDDTLNVAFTDIYGLFTAEIDEASERYNPDAVLVGRVTRQNNGFKADFVYLVNEERQRFEVTADSRRGLMHAVVDRVGLRLAEQYAVVLDPALAGQLSLRVNAVSDLATLAEVERYLESLNVISQATLRQVAPDSIQFDLEISGDRTQFQDVLALDDRLSVVEETDLASQLDTELVYEWVGR